MIIYLKIATGNDRAHGMPQVYFNAGKLVVIYAAGKADGNGYITEPANIEVRYGEKFLVKTGLLWLYWHIGLKWGEHGWRRYKAGKLWFRPINRLVSVTSRVYTGNV